MTGLLMHIFIFCMVLVLSWSGVSLCNFLCQDFEFLVYFLLCLLPSEFLVISCFILFSPLVSALLYTSSSVVGFTPVLVNLACLFKSYMHVLQSFYACLSCSLVCLYSCLCFLCFLFCFLLCLTVFLSSAMIQNFLPFFAVGFV